MVLESRPGLKQTGISYPDFQDWQRSSRSFAQMAALTSRSYDLTSPGTSEHLDGMEVTSGFFATLGVKLVHGQEFSPSEDRPHEATTVVISDRLWRDRFASNPEALGKTITLDGLGYTIIGILPPKFQLWTDIDVYTSLAQNEPLLYQRPHNPFDRLYRPHEARCEHGSSARGTGRRSRRISTASIPPRIETWGSISNHSSGRL